MTATTNTVTTKYLSFRKHDPLVGRKTDVWHIYSVNHGDLLGIIKWAGRWRQYVFFPTQHTMWNKDCLNDIEQFLVRIMADRRATPMEDAK
jgi:hypothetical protein